MGVKCPLCWVLLSVNLRFSGPTNGRDRDASRVGVFGFLLRKVFVHSPVHLLAPIARRRLLAPIARRQLLAPIARRRLLAPIARCQRLARWSSQADLLLGKPANSFSLAACISRAAVVSVCARAWRSRSWIVTSALRCPAKPGNCRRISHGVAYHR